MRYTALLSWLPMACSALMAAAGEPQIQSVEKIWDQGPHNAFTDLARFRDQWWCTFREGSGHVPGTDGKIRVITSNDGKTWESAALVAEPGIDLRDPKFALVPDGRLMIVAGGSRYVPDQGQKGARKTLAGRQPRVLFSTDGRQWTPPEPVLAMGDWLWRVTWHKGKAYGVSYNIDAAKGAAKDWSVKLYSSSDGLHYDQIADWDIPGKPNETTVRFLADDRMVAFVRREAGNGCAWIGVGEPPYTKWSWHETTYRVGGPNFIVLPDGALWAATRIYPPAANTEGACRTMLARFGPETFEPAIRLPSGGDTSYAGLVWHDGVLWMSYYSGHEGKTSIYLAKIRLPK